MFELEEDSNDKKTSVIAGTENFLNNIWTGGRVQKLSPPAEFKSVASDALHPVTMVKGQILPMTFTLYSQTRDSATTFMLLLNPTTLNYGSTNAVQALYTRQGYVTQLWGPNLMMLSSTGKSAAFMVASRGLSDYFERQSIGYRNLTALIAAYKNNGYVFIDPVHGSVYDRLTRVIQYVEGVKMTYDGNSFLGHFNNFTLDDSAEHPFCIHYSFEFIIDAFAGNDSEIRGHYAPGLNDFNSNNVENFFSVSVSQLVDYTEETIKAENQASNFVASNFVPSNERPG